MPLPVIGLVRALSQSEFDVLAFGAAVVLVLAFIKQIAMMAATSNAIELERAKARTDFLTGLLNHGAVVDEALRLINETPPQRVSIALVDLDDLKLINDHFGHAAGDAALKALARRLGTLEGVIGRYGGDEFLVVRPSPWPRSPQLLAFDLKECLAGGLSWSGGEAHACFGVATFPDDGPDFPAILQVADAAMYLQKQSRKGTPPGAPDTAPPYLKDTA
jgi:diguanylate cyclase (GGDEF)-like protein